MIGFWLSGPPLSFPSFVYLRTSLDLPPPFPIGLPGPSGNFVPLKAMDIPPPKKTFLF